MSGDIIGSKGLDDMPLFSSMERQELYSGMEKSIRGGTPDSIPLAVMSGTLGRLARTMKAYEAMLYRVVAEGKKVELIPESDRTTDAQRTLQLGIEAAKLLNVGPPIAIPTQKQKKVILS